MPVGVYKRPERKCPHCGGAPGTSPYYVKLRWYICAPCARKYFYPRGVKRRKARGKSILAAYKRSAKTQRIRYPERVKARMAVSRAIASGKIVKPKTCCHCNATGRIEGHHFNGYENALDVLWLCVPCHRDRHRAKAKELEGK